MKYLTSLALIGLAATPLSAQEKDWNFGDGVSPERWATVNAAYALCDAGLHQSPIDLGAANARGDIALETKFGETSGTISLGTEKVQVDFPAGLGMNSGGKEFALIQVHFHTPSEHAISGKRYPLVAHFVHATESGELGVLGVMFKEGDANPALETIVAGVGAGKGAAVEFDVNDMVPEDTGIYRYMGSLTTPPCSEGVNWHVADEVMTASAEQIAAMEANLGPSARSIQPLGTRLLVAPE
ncbi:carbonic anhydrase family protein [Qipengyuania sp. GH38]|uniref:carbonic anhydrase n=1 Tax=Qipengyuania intermedia TaxID=2867244 RepID=UPI001C88702E|nr:carbonic anhydrase family protein [Qipengyuania intermedia]MBX7512937.1 carbonic anhydrase family protein [Qipengyuania intermedia]